MPVTLVAKKISLALTRASEASGQRPATGLFHFLTLSFDGNLHSPQKAPFA